MPIYKMPGKKDGRQQYRVRINYTDANGKARQLDRVAYGMAEAKELEARLQQEHHQNGISHSMTIAALVAEYMSHKKHEVRATTWDKSNRNLKRAVIEPLGNVRIDRLSRVALMKWKDSISAQNLSVATKKGYYKEFHALLNYAVKMEYLPKNPLDSVGTFKDVYFQKPQDKLQYYTPEQFRQYISAARESANTITDWGYYVFFCIAFFTGMRKGEINALKWSDIDGNIIHVRRSISQKIKGEPVTETPPKNRSSYRDLQIPLPLKAVLDEHKKRQQTDNRFNENFRVCGGICCLSDTSIENKNTQFSKAAGLPHIRIHDFRHSHASLLVNEGINIQEIARRLGHSDIKMTWNTYSHLYPREEERAMNVLDKIVF